MFSSDSVRLSFEKELPVSEAPFFYGSYENRLNSKGQVAVPKRFRSVVSEEELAQGFVLVRGEGRSIYMYTHRQFGEIKSRVREVALGEGDPEFFRSFLENASAVELDTQGRVVLPAALRKTAGIEGPAVLFVGMDDRIEIWEPGERESSRGGTGEYEERRTQNARRIFGM